MDAPAELPGRPEELLLLALESDRLLIGEILLGRDFTLRHHADEGVKELSTFSDLASAREIAKFDAVGNFRPLRSAPTLRRGWLIQVANPKEMLMALEEFYPAALGLWLSSLHGMLAPTPLRETLGRQTGMYRVTQLLRDDQAREIIVARCGEGCLRTVLWDLEPGHPLDFLPPERRTMDSHSAQRIPLLCCEACNLLVADARPVAKRNVPEENQSPT
jgi:sirohydrochlorin cobaltochelatase